MESLYEQMRKSQPYRFKIRENTIYIDAKNPCKTCVVRDSRNPVDCDPCTVNPDRERLKKARLL